MSKGIIAALRRGAGTDNALMIVSFVGVPAPQFVVGLLMLYVFAVQLHWFPLAAKGHLRIWFCQPLPWGYLAQEGTIA